MTRTEAISFLVKCSRRAHLIHYATVGPSHGDPGGWSYIDKQCSCFVMENGKLVADSELPCDCGANVHNALVAEAINLLVTPPQT